MKSIGSAFRRVIQAALALGACGLGHGASSARNEAAWRAQIVDAFHLPAALPALSVETRGQLSPEPGVVAVFPSRHANFTGRCYS